MNFEIAPKSTERILTWHEARLYCFSLGIDGNVGWRLPTKDELNVIYKSDNDFVGLIYWSSTENKGNNAWWLSFGSGTQYADGKDYSHYVRAVRTIAGAQTDVRFTRCSIAWRELPSGAHPYTWS
jgi:hypothetical protein